MRETTISIIGHAVPITYTVFEGAYIDWQVPKQHPLLNILLRTHYNEYICGELLRMWFEEEYEQNQINSAQLSLLHHDVPF